MEKHFSHIVEIDEALRILKIERLYSDGRKELFTETAIPEILPGSDKNVVSEFALMLGENLLLDSPTARKLLSLKK